MLKRWMGLIPDLFLIPALMSSGGRAMAVRVALNSGSRDRRHLWVMAIFNWKQNRNG